MYDPSIGRWLTEDPIGFEAEDPNFYRYVGNSPTNAKDPTGLLTWTGLIWFIPQNAIYVQPQSGGGSYPTNAAQLLTQLQAIQANGGRIGVLIIKGHGGPQGIIVGPDRDGVVLVTTPNPNGIWLGTTDITKLLRAITDQNSYISLRGCMNAALANRIARILGNGAVVHGELTPSIGIPGTTITIGPGAEFGRPPGPLTPNDIRIADPLYIPPPDIRRPPPGTNYGTVD